MDIDFFADKRCAETLTFLRDALFDYRGKKVIGYEVFSLLLNDPKLKLRARKHIEIFYPEGLVKGYKPEGGSDGSEEEEG